MKATTIANDDSETNTLKPRSHHSLPHVGLLGSYETGATFPFPGQRRPYVVLVFCVSFIHFYSPKTLATINNTIQLHNEKNNKGMQ